VCNLGFIECTEASIEELVGIHSVVCLMIGP
jgi:hypothetical protein